MPVKQKNEPKGEKTSDPITGDGERKSIPSDAEFDELIRTNGKDALKEIARLALKSDLKDELRIRCLLYLADLWAKNARKKLEAASDFEAVLAEIARRAARQYDKKQKQRRSGQDG